MQQSTRCRFSSPTSRVPGGVLAGALVLALVACATIARAESAGTPAADDASGVTGAIADRPSAEPAGADSLRPRWIAPRRGDGTVPITRVSGRAWERDAQVIVHAVPDAARLAALVADVLERLGSEAVERRSVNVPASTDQVRFFHAEDADMATALAAELEMLFGEVRVRDLTFYRPQPESGSLEVWLR